MKKQSECVNGSAMMAGGVKCRKVAEVAMDVATVMNVVEAVRSGAWMPEGDRAGLCGKAEQPWCVCSQRKLCKGVRISTKTYIQLVKIEKKSRCMC